MYDTALPAGLREELGGALGYSPRQASEMIRRTPFASLEVLEERPT